MKRYVFPAVLFADEKKQTKTLLVPDLDIVASGTTVEDVYFQARDFVAAYLEFTVKMGGTIVRASKYEDVKKQNLKRTVLLVEASVADKYVLTKEEEEYKNFVAQYLVDSEDESDE